MSSEPSSAKRRFSRKQVLVLCAVLVAGTLVWIATPQLRDAYRSWQIMRAQRPRAIAQGALHRAIAQNQGADRVREALAAGAHLSVVMEDGSAPFHAAITLGQCESVEAMLEYGADVERSDYYRDRQVYRHASSHGPPLLAAVDCEQPTDIKIRMVRILLAHGADIRREDDGCNLMDLAARDGDGEMGDFLREQGLPYGPCEMAAFNRIEELKRAVQDAPELLHERFKPVGYKQRKCQVSTLLGIAVRKGYRDMALWLMEARAPLDALEDGGQTPLHIAATLSGDPELIRIVAARQVDLNARDDDQHTPLTAVLDWVGRTAAATALIEVGADVNAVGPRGTPLYMAVRKNDVPMVEMLIKAGADPKVPNRDGENALELARKQRPELLELLEKAAVARGTETRP